MPENNATLKKKNRELREQVNALSEEIRKLKEHITEHATTPDKTVETFQYNFQFRAMLSSCPEGTNSSPSPPLVQCCFGSAVQACISSVTANNIAIGEGGNSLLICDSKHFCQGECKK